VVEILEQWVIEIEPDESCDCCTGGLTWQQTFQLRDNATIVEINNDHNGIDREVYPFDSQKKATTQFYAWLAMRVKQQRQELLSNSLVLNEVKELKSKESKRGGNGNQTVTA
tara:strand:+ start:1755 stop:2090 length:336 start_codon:yes stop_codon:yes gene_type:complete